MHVLFVFPTETFQPRCCVRTTTNQPRSSFVLPSQATLAHAVRRGGLYLEHLHNQSINSEEALAGVNLPTKCQICGTTYVANGCHLPVSESALSKQKSSGSHIVMRRSLVGDIL